MKVNTVAIGTVFALILEIRCSALLSTPPVEHGEVSPGHRHTVPLHRQRVPVKSEGSRVSYKSVYFGSVAVGSPVQQNFTVVFDTGSGHVVLPSSWCSSETCLIHSRFDPEASATAVDVEHDGTPVQPGAPRDQITVAYGTGEVTGQFINDRLCLGVRNHQADHHCVELRIVMATEMTYEPFHAFAFDGVLGLGLDSLALTPEFSFFGMMTTQKFLDQPSFGVFLADSDDEFSEISFGGHAPEHLQTRLTWAPVALPEFGYWQVQIKSLRVGNKTLSFCDDGQCRAVVDTGTSLLAVPTPLAGELQGMLEETILDPPVNEDGKLDCRKAKGSDIVFEVEETLLALSPGDYARASMQLQDENDESWSTLEEASLLSSEEDKEHLKATSSCRPTIMPMDLPEPLGPKLFIWGEPILRKYYTVYNWKEKTIGFALAKHLSDVKPTLKTQRKPLLL